MTKIISNTSSPLISEKKTNRRLLDLFRSPVGLIRLGSILFAILTVGHISGYPWSMEKDPPQKQLITSMRSIDVVFVGEHTSFWALYSGWGLYVAVLLLSLTIFVWFLSDVALLAPRRVGIMIQIISVSCLAEAYLSFRFFYIPPFLLSLAIFIILQTAAVRLMRRK